MRLQWRSFIAVLVLSDMLMAAIAFWLAYFVRFELALPIFRLDIGPALTFYTRLILVILLVWVCVFYFVGLYSRDKLLGGTQEYAAVFRGTTYGLLLVVFAGYLEPNLIIARGWLFLAWGFSLTFISLGRFGLRRLIYRLRVRGFFLLPAIIVGANEEAQLLIEQLKGWKTSGLQLVGVVADGVPAGESLWEGLPALGSLADLDEIIERNDIREVILATSALNRAEMLTIFEQHGFSDRINLRLSSGLFEIITTGLQVKELAYVPLVSVDKVRLRGLDLFLKTMLDYGLTLPGLIFLSPIMVLIALMIKLSSKGPIIHRRRVMGINGKEFDAFKFRTMSVDGDEILANYPELEAELKENHKLKFDPRVSKAGKLLRKLSLDELPQLMNVLRGEMSLVGPRMISPEEMVKYNQWGINLLTVKPGITGLWQVSGRSDVSYEERVRMDMYYIRNWTIWLDLYLLVNTLQVVMKTRGAY